MSVAKLLLSGLLVASGIILGAFTLHGYFAPRWEVQATAMTEDGVPQTAGVFQEQSRPAPGAIVPDRWTPKLMRAEPDAEAEAVKARKRQAEKKAAERRLAQKKPKEEEEKEEEPQTVFPWLWNLLANAGK